MGGPPPLVPISTPEALLGRNDSKNPATTCKGITSSGRPCRRALAARNVTAAQRRRASVATWNGASFPPSEDEFTQETDLYCWQHKEQASLHAQEADVLAAKHSRRRRSTDLASLQERTSIDTMMQRLGINDEVLPQQPPKTARDKRVMNHTSIPDRAKLSGDRRAEQVALNGDRPDNGQRIQQRPRRSKKPSFWDAFCCGASSEDDYLEVVRHKRRVDHRSEHQQRPQDQRISAAVSHPDPVAERRRESYAAPLPQHAARRHSSSTMPRPSPMTQRSSQTDRLLSLISPDLSPQVTSSLLAELAKPISAHDEDGYIYIFWLTPQTKQAPAESTARSLLAPNMNRPQHNRRISDVMTEYSFDGTATETKGKNAVMLKIGRANNVTRRMQEWQKQCGYELNLIRWYPYTQSSTTPSPHPSPRRASDRADHDFFRPSLDPRRESDSVRKVPFVKRVERLIHLELAEKQAKRQCSACGREHREWFEIPASQAGIRSVDECIRKWVGWAERKASE